MDLCDDAADWHDWLAGHVGTAVGRRGPLGERDAHRHLRHFVAEQFGDRYLDSHDWAYTPGTGRMLDHLLGAVPPDGRGAVLPTYQRVAASLPAGAAETSVVLPPARWAEAGFTPPCRPPALFVVNPVHANPVAASLSREFLDDLAGYARSEDVLVVEDDAFRGTGPDDSGPPEMLGRCPDRTVYLGSWTKALGWPVKAGIVGWPRAASRARLLRPGAPVPPPELPMDVSAVLAAGLFGAIQRHRRERLDPRRAAVTALLRAASIGFVPPTGGAHVAVLVPRAELLRRSLVSAGLGGLGAETFYQQGGSADSFVRLGLSNVTSAAWPSLLDRLAEVLAGDRPDGYPGPAPDGAAGATDLAADGTQVRASTL
ncbi:aminotransferase class I/II-fold pyridoxal phosphate-dependent enzyme [Plantactinospora sp. B6F1]|uniref:aminotransferase class I/II-fold pyridoxal phosphate-dependent enzyme n=1 Tax=Plantactinospora sp. B6F1 TaxID=3158971 RepID=UPI0032D97455